MARLSKQAVEVSDILLYRSDLESSLQLFYSASATNPRFLGYSPSEVREELDKRIAELNLTSMLILLSAIEAAFRVDYQLRCYRGPADRLSQAFRKLHKRKSLRVNLETEIIGAWKDETNVNLKLIGQLRGAFKLRHWIAHGRYWEPKLGKKYDFVSILALATETFTQFPFLRPL